MTLKTLASYIVILYLFSFMVACQDNKKVKDGMSTIENNNILECSLSIDPQVFQKGKAVKITYSLKNVSPKPVFVVSIPQFIHFRIVDARGKIIKDGMESYFFLSTAIQRIDPEKLEPNKCIKRSATSRIDKPEFGFERASYDLAPGKYFFYLVYRYEPQKVSYNVFCSNPKAWEGMVISKPVEVSIKNMVTKTLR